MLQFLRERLSTEVCSEKMTMIVRRLVDHTFKEWLNSEAQDGCLREGSGTDSPWPPWLETRVAGDVIGARHDGQSACVVVSSL